MRCSIRSSTSVVKVRTVPRISQRSGTTLVASPVWIIVTEITPVSSGRLLRVMMVWKACTIWQATGTGSTPRCGIAACEPLPWIVMRNSLLLANTGPVFSANWPTFSPGQLCAPNTASIGKRSNRPSLIIPRAPPPAFLGRLEDQVHRAVEGPVLREMLGGRKQHGRVAVVAAGVHLAGVPAGVREGVVLGDRQRVDVGAQSDRTVRTAALHDADHSGGTEPAMDRDAPVCQGLRDHVGGAALLEAQLRVGMQVTADRGDGGTVGQDGFDQLHRALPRGPTGPAVEYYAGPWCRRARRAPRPPGSKGLCHDFAMNLPADDVLSPGDRTVRGACPHDCPDTCALRVTVRDGRAVKVQGDADHPTTQGALCTKVSRYPERTYHPERVLHPLRRVGTQGHRALRARRLGRGAGCHRDAPAGDRRARSAGRRALQLCRHDGPGAGREHGRALLPPPGRLAARPHHLLQRRRRGADGKLRRQGRHARRAFRRSQADPDLGQQQHRVEPALLDLRPGRQARRRKGWCASTRAVPRRPTSATSTSRCCPGPTARWRSV